MNINAVLVVVVIMEHYIISVILYEFMLMNGCMNRISDAEFIILVSEFFLIVPYLNIYIEGFSVRARKYGIKYC